MDTLLDKIEKLFINKKIEISDMELFQYGLRRLFTNAIVITNIIVISAILHTTISTMILLSTMLYLRSKTGGYHFDDSRKCFLFSIIIPIILGWEFQVIDVSKRILLSCSIIASLLTVLLAPIDHPNRKLDENEKNHFRKAILISIIFLYFIVIVFDNVFHIYYMTKFIEIGIIMNFISLIFALISNSIRCKNR